MTEEKVKSRGWVKNAAIIFLSVMLLLTFFSNTIQNYSLPEVAAQYAQSGTITTRIRGSGKIEATETFEVKADDTRKVKSVAVRVGDAVEVGDLLVTLAEGESGDLEAAKQALESAQFSYQSALLDIDAADENGETAAIARAKEKLAEAMEIREYATKVSVADIYKSKENWENAQDLADVREDQYNEAAARLAAAGGYTPGGGGSADYAAVSAAQIALDAIKIRYQDAYNALKYLAEYEYSINKKYSVAAYMQSLAAEFDSIIVPSPVATNPPGDSGAGEGKSTGTSESTEAVTDTAETMAAATPPPVADRIKAEDRTPATGANNIHNPAVTVLHVNISDPYVVDAFTEFSKEDMATAYSKITAAQDTLNSASAAYSEAISDASSVNGHLKNAEDKAKAAWDVEKARADRYKAIYDDLSAKKNEYDTADQNVLSAQDSLEAAVAAQARDNLNLQQLRAAVGRAQKQVAEASGAGGEGGEIHSDVHGVVKSVNVSAGGSTSPGTPILTIEVPDRGYSVSIGVTTEQAKRVSIGDSAEITTNYWGGPQLTGRLAAIRPDPQNPQTNRLLVFDVTGDEVTSDTQVSVSIGQKSQSYDVIVPNAAVREDSNGSFVLVIIVKSSPLGNRYVATRVDVQVLAKDDTNTAVSGGVASWDFVLTSSTRPIESGMLVRMADNY